MCVSDKFVFQEVLEVTSRMKIKSSSISFVHPKIYNRSLLRSTFCIPNNTFLRIFNSSINKCCWNNSFSVIPRSNCNNSYTNSIFLNK